MARGENGVGSSTTSSRTSFGALTDAENVKKPARFEFRDGLDTDHAAVGDDADATVEKRWRRWSTTGTSLLVSAIAGPRLRAYRPAITVQEHGEDHLAQVWPMILGIAMLAERLPAGALEIETGRVHEYEIELEQVAPTGEQTFLDDVLEAAR